MNSLTALIIGAPAVLAVIAFKKAERQSSQPKPGYAENWTWPKKWRPVAKTEGR